MKKILCIKEFSGEFGKEISNNKEYEVMKENKDYYTIENDNGKVCDYYKLRFKEV